MNEREFYLVGLNLLGIFTPKILKKLVEEFKDPKELFFAKEKDLRRFIKSENLVRKFLEKRQKICIEDEIKKAQKENIKIISYEDEEYPKSLKNIENYPLILYVKGDIRGIGRAIAIVGTRRPTEYGIYQASKFAKALAVRGFVIVSGFAVGIDTAAHRATIEEKQKTVAILGCGLCYIYPKINQDLHIKIPKYGGALISEFSLDTPPFKMNFPQRNRIISGISMGVLIVEAPLRSGALITANYAIEQGKEVFVIPHQASLSKAEGSNQLIKEGAKMVTSPADILEEFENIIEEEELDLSEDERVVLEVIKSGCIFINEIKQKTNMDFSKLFLILLKLEQKGIIKSLFGKRYLKI